MLDALGNVLASLPAVKHLQEGYWLLAKKVSACNKKLFPFKLTAFAINAAAGRLQGAHSIESIFGLCLPLFKLIRFMVLRNQRNHFRRDVCMIFGFHYAYQLIMQNTICSIVCMHELSCSGGFIADKYVSKSFPTLTRHTCNMTAFGLQRHACWARRWRQYPVASNTNPIRSSGGGKV